MFRTYSFHFFVMISYFLFYFSHSSIEYGSTKVFITDNDSFNLNFNDDSVFLFATENTKLNSEKFNKRIMKTGQFLEIDQSVNNIQTPDKNTTFYLWRVPKKMCENSFSVSDDYLIDFSLKNEENIKDNTCIFFQPDAVAYFFSSSLETSSKQCNIELHTHNTVHNNEKPIQLGKTYKTSKASPFFLRFSGCEGSELSFKFHMTVARSKLGAHECNIQSIPTISGNVNERSLFVVNRCVAASHQLIEFLKYAVIIFILLCFIIGFISSLPKKERIGHIAALEKK